MAPTGSVASSSNSTSPSASSTTATPTIDKDMFLQLLVAQLKNQDPLNPTDSATFVTQLAQFEQLENTINQGQDISAIRTDADSIAAQFTGNSSGGSGTTGSGATGS